MRRLMLLGGLTVATVTAVVPHAVRDREGNRLHRGAIPVRYREGTVHGFLELRTERGRLLANGDLLQVPGDSGVVSRMVFHFRDRSSFEETTTFTQQQAFRLNTYHLIQEGPAFSADLDATLFPDGRYVVRSRSHNGGKVERYEGRLELPADVYNGMPVVIAKNLRPGDTATVHLVAFTPKPQLIGLRFAFAGMDTITIGAQVESAARFVLSPRLGAVKGFFARLLGKLPPDSRVWIASDQVPTFVRFEGPMYAGPVWRLMLASPTWPAEIAGRTR